MPWAQMNLQQQWDDANSELGSGFVLKAYLPGTTTSTSIAIDSSGGSPQATITANAEGKWEVSGNEVIPFIDRDHKWAIFSNASDATANSNPFAGFYDNIPLDGIASRFQIDNYVTLRGQLSSTYNDNDALQITDDAIGGVFVVKTGTVVDNDGTRIVFTDDSNRYAERLFDGKAPYAEWFNIVIGDSSDRLGNSAILQNIHTEFTDIHFSADSVYFFDKFVPDNKPFNFIGSGLGDRDDEDENTVLDFEVSTVTYAINIAATKSQAVQSSIRGMLIKCPTDKKAIYMDNIGISLYEVMIKADVCVTMDFVTGQTFKDCIFMAGTKAIHIGAGSSFCSNMTFDNIKAFTNYTAGDPGDICVHINGTGGNIVQGNTWINLDCEQGATGLKIEGYVRDVFQGLWIEGMSAKWVDEDGDSDQRNVFINPVFGAPSQTNTFSPTSQLIFGDNVRSDPTFKDLTNNVTIMTSGADGNWLKPLQSRFRAILAATQEDIGSSDTAILFATESYDKGGDYTAASSKYTTPVAGTYHFGVKIRIDNADTAASAYSLKVKAAGSTIMAVVENPGMLPGDGFFNIRLFGDFDLAASVDITVTVSQSGGSTQADINAASSESYFYGHLIG